LTAKSPVFWWKKIKGILMDLQNDDGRLENVVNATTTKIRQYTFVYP